MSGEAAGKARASIFADADQALPELDLKAFKARSKPAPADAERAALRSISEASDFPSRAPRRGVEPRPGSQAQEPPAYVRPTRRHRTGRNVQLNVKVSPATADAFYGIADRQGWMLAETFEQALRALEEKLSVAVPTKGKAR